MVQLQIHPQIKQASFKMGDIFSDGFGLLPSLIDIGGKVWVKDIEADIAEDNKDRVEAQRALEEERRRASGATGGIGQYQTPLIIGAVGLGLIGILIAVLKK